MRRYFSQAFVLIPFLLLFWQCRPFEILLFLLAAALHELGHLLAMLCLRCRPAKFSFSIGGAKIETDAPLLSYRREIVLFLSGPLANLLGCAAAFLWIRTQLSEPSLYFFFCNTLFCLINLIPIRGLDGERALSAFLSLYWEVGWVFWFSFWISRLFLLSLLGLGLFLFIEVKNGSLLLLAFSLLLEDVAGQRKKATNIS